MFTFVISFPLGLLPPLEQVDHILLDFLVELVGDGDLLALLVLLLLLQLPFLRSHYIYQCDIGRV